MRSTPLRVMWQDARLLFSQGASATARALAAAGLAMIWQTGRGCVKESDREIRRSGGDGVPDQSTRVSVVVRWWRPRFANVIVVGAISGLRRVRLTQMVWPGGGIYRYRLQTCRGTQRLQHLSGETLGVVSAPACRRPQLRSGASRQRPSGRCPDNSCRYGSDGRARPGKDPVRTRSARIETGRCRRARATRRAAARRIVRRPGGARAVGIRQRRGHRISGGAGLGGRAGAAGGVVELSLEVTRTNGASYPARTNAAFSTPRHRDQATAVGTQLSVRVDPTDPTPSYEFDPGYGTTG